MRVPVHSLSYLIATNEGPRQVAAVGAPATGGEATRLADQLAHAAERVSRASTKTQHEDSELHIALGDLYGCVGRAVQALKERQNVGTSQQVQTERNVASSSMVLVPRELLRHAQYKCSDLGVQLAIHNYLSAPQEEKP